MKKVTKQDNKKHRFMIIRIIYAFVGFLSLILGCIGIVLPILPTVPFFLLTLFCFTKSSKKFHDWFIASKLYKRHLETFAVNRAMFIVHECILLLLVSLMLITTMFFVNKLAVTIILNVLLLCKYSYFIFRVRSLPAKKIKALKAKSLEASK